MAKNIFCDSSSLISMSMSCNLGAIGFLHSMPPRPNFLITPAVKAETVSTPMNSRRFEYSAIRINQLVWKKELEMYDSPRLSALSSELGALANSSIIAGGRFVPLLQIGELQAVAGALLKGADAVMVDEKTARLLIEAPQILQQRISEEYATNARLNEKPLAAWKERTKGLKIIRSTELIAIAAQKGFFSKYEELEREAFLASLYALRSAGCSLSSSELAQYEKIKL